MCRNGIWLSVQTLRIPTTVQPMRMIAFNLYSIMETEGTVSESEGDTPFVSIKWKAYWLGAEINILWARSPPSTQQHLHAFVLRLGLRNPAGIQNIFQNVDNCDIKFCHLKSESCNFCFRDFLCVFVKSSFSRCLCWRLKIESPVLLSYFEYLLFFDLRANLVD